MVVRASSAREACNLHDHTQLPGLRWSAESKLLVTNQIFINDVHFLAYCVKLNSERLLITPGARDVDHFVQLYLSENIRSFTQFCFRHSPQLLVDFKVTEKRSETTSCLTKEHTTRDLIISTDATKSNLPRSWAALAKS